MATDSYERSKAQIEADLAASRARISANISELVDEVHPKRIVQRQVESAKEIARTEATALTGLVRTEDGRWRTDRLAAIGAAVAGVIGAVLVAKGINRRR